MNVLSHVSNTPLLLEQRLGSRVCEKSHFLSISSRAFPRPSISAPLRPKMSLLSNQDYVVSLSAVRSQAKVSKFTNLQRYARWDTILQKPDE